MSIELDASTAELLEKLSRAWGVSKDEVVKRALSQADAAPNPVTRSERLSAFRELQRCLQLSPEQAAAWQQALHDARR